jgi:hypothetical protein
MLTMTATVSKARQRPFDRRETVAIIPKGGTQLCVIASGSHLLHPETLDNDAPLRNVIVSARLISPSDFPWHIPSGVSGDVGSFCVATIFPVQVHCTRADCP